MTIDAAFEAWRDRARGADILDAAMRLGFGAGLKQRSREHVGACPRGCSGGGAKGKKPDGFAINTSKQVFSCRPGGAGGDVIAMVMHAQAVAFLAACELINGEPPPAQGTQLTPEAKAAADHARVESAERAKRRDADDNLYRQRERRTVADIFARAHPLAGSSAADYLARRGLSFPPTPEGRAERIKCVEAMPYHVGKDTVVHRGPAMVMPIVDAGRVFRGLHLTWLDLTTPKGKLALEHEGELLDAKKSRGSVSGNHVELIGPIAPRRLVLAEGAEKAIAVWQALAHNAARGLLPVGGIPLDETAFWSACNLGNLAGAASDTIAHPTRRHARTNRVAKVAGLVPDFSAPAIAIPDSVVDLVLLGDSTSDEFTTRLALCRAAARYARPGLAVRVAWAPAGADFDDLWRMTGTDEVREHVARTIVDILEAAAPPQVPEAFGQLANTDQLISKDGASAPIAPELQTAAEHREGVEGTAERRRDSGEQRAASETGAGAAGAPDGLPAANAAPSGEDPPAPDLGPEPPPPAAPPPSADESNSSRTGAIDAPPSHLGEGPARAGSGNAARAADRTQWSGPPRKYGDDEFALDRWLASFPLTDLGNVERFYHRHRGRLLWCAALGWHWWDGRRWSREGGDEKATLAEHETARAIQREAQAIVGTDQDIVVGGTDKDPIMLSDRLFAWGRTSENASRLNPMSKRAASSLAVQPHALDADPFMINVANGTLVVRRAWDRPLTPAQLEAGWHQVSPSIRLKPHDPADLVTKISPVAFKADATCPAYEEFMHLVQPSRGVQRFIDDFDGYSLTGDPSEQVLVFHHGKGKNGKSTQINIKLYIAGDYGRSIPIETFAQEGRARQAGQATPDLAMLHRVRYLSTSEPQKNWKLDEALIKVLTGGDEVPVRELHRSYFMLKPEFKLGMNGNYKPRIDGGEADSGMWRRVKLVPWAVTIPKETRDKHFGDKLKAEAAGILNRMLRGLERWMRDGLVDAAEVAAATEQFRQDSDPLGRFLEHCTKPVADGRVQTSALYSVFCAWAKAFGEAEWKPNGFGRAMNERGFVSVKVSVNYWVGLELTRSVSDFLDHEGRPLLLGGEDGRGSNADDGAAGPAPSGERRRPSDLDDDREGF